MGCIYCSDGCVMNGSRVTWPGYQRVRFYRTSFPHDGEVGLEFRDDNGKHVRLLIPAAQLSDIAEELLWRVRDTRVRHRAALTAAHIASHPESDSGTPCEEGSPE